MTRAIVTLLLLGSIAACSSDPDNTITLDSTTTTATVETTTTDAPTTSSTAIPSSSDSPTTIPTTTVAEPSTTTPPIDPEAQVRADFDATIAVRLACGQDPATCDFQSFGVPGSPIDSYTRELMANRVAANQRTVAGKGSYEWRIDEVTVLDSSAFVTTCIFDSLVVFDVADILNPNDDLIVNDNQSSRLVRIEMRMHGGRWLFFDNETLQESTTGDLCGF